ncbi:hypothetical protein Sango_0530700 [Sesamum angolense]|uniref:DC1 domain-containing protein n=1 Tax=Sesamum angolense TaxID=2727404 RepID=A0AAE2C168_9LAMI|nr:hypothetical protein Sango_0530700 [Sesamum angolense]
MKYSEISHFSHPHHNLKFEYAEAPFKCDGCKEVGIGSSYKCGGAACNFDLHTHCAVPSPSITHPFYTKCSFQFLSRPPGQEARYCNACEKSVTGFLYHCKLCGFDLHPCCAKLPMVLDDGDIKLHLLSKVWEKGEELELQILVQEVPPTRGVREGDAADSWHELYNGSGGYTYTGGRKSVPSLKATLETHSNHKKSSKGKAQKCCEVAGLALQFVVSALLGDPTTLIAGLVGTLMSK